MPIEFAGVSSAELLSGLIGNRVADLGLTDFLFGFFSMRFSRPGMNDRARSDIRLKVVTPLPEVLPDQFTLGLVAQVSVRDDGEHLNDEGISATLVEIVLEEGVAMRSPKQSTAVVGPPHLELTSTANVETVVGLVGDLVDPTLVGVPVVDEPHTPREV